jgi:hypothetical protein
VRSTGSETCLLLCGIRSSRGDWLSELRVAPGVGNTTRAAPDRLPGAALSLHFGPPSPTT